MKRAQRRKAERQKAKQDARQPRPPLIDVIALFNQVSQFHALGRSGDARAVYDLILAQKGVHAEVLHAFAMSAFRGGMPDHAARLATGAIHLTPRNAEYFNTLGMAQAGLKQAPEATASYERALALSPHLTMAMNNLGDLMRDSQKLDSAVAYYRRALAITPQNVYSLNNMSETLLKIGDTAEALRAIDQCLHLEPARISALAIKAVALSELGRLEDLNHLMDLTSLIQCRTAETPSPFADLAAFNAELADYIGRHPSLRVHPESISTRNGKQTAGNLLLDQHPLIPCLAELIHKAVVGHAKGLAVDCSHIHHRSVPARYRASAWATYLGEEGYQDSHVHYDGWMSGVYYVQIPAQVRSEQNPLDRQGWIEFGRGQADLYQRSAPPTRFIQPSAGMMVTFPSYFWHRTIPFSAPEPRISIAFDVIPL